MTRACRSASGATKSCLSGTCTRNTSSREHSAPSGSVQDAVTKMVLPEYPASGADRSWIRTSWWPRPASWPESQPPSASSSLCTERQKPLRAPGRRGPGVPRADVHGGHVHDRRYVLAHPGRPGLVAGRRPRPVHVAAPVKARKRVAGLIAGPLAGGRVPLVEQLHLLHGPPVVLARPLPVTRVLDDLERGELEVLTARLWVVRPVDDLVDDLRAVDVVPQERRVHVRGEGHGALEEPLDLGGAVERPPEGVLVGSVRRAQVRPGNPVLVDRAGEEIVREGALYLVAADLGCTRH